MSSDCPGVGKSSWPELVGVAGDAAEAIIEQENPSVNAMVVTPDTIYLPAIFCDRVLVFVGADGIVNRVPTVG